MKLILLSAVLAATGVISCTQRESPKSQKFTTALEFLEANEQVYFNGSITLLIAIGEEVKKIDKQLLQTIIHTNDEHTNFLETNNYCL